MKKKIPCPDCKGIGGRTVMNGIKTDPCGVAFERCAACDGTGIVFVDMTRAEKIRAMSDEELAKALYHFGDAPFCRNMEECKTMLDSDIEIPDEKCISCALRWLQEVEA